jgi:sterol desaturase/sphingolipid hydroxylase (fatty acid hydroxylase superfamily)
MTGLVWLASYPKSGSPVFHRWHHSADAERQSKNFAPMFPVWDLMFGTFYMPRGRRPEAFGAEGVPDGLLGQLAHPFAAWGRSA